MRWVNYEEPAGTLAVTGNVVRVPGSSQQLVPMQRSAAALRPRLTAWPTLAR